MTTEPAHGAFDEADPHHEHHKHVIVRVSTLTAVLVVLLVFTVATVGASEVEKWISAEFDVVIPQWINAGIAMSIAVVKSTLVAMYFMQLKYDKLLNAVVFLFCLFGLGLFLFVSMTDLGTRSVIYTYKEGEIQKGGLGLSTERRDQAGNLLGGLNTGGKPIVVWAREKRIEEVGEEQYWKEYAEAHAHSSHHAPHEETGSTANQSRPRRGTTEGLFDEHAPAGDGHGGGGGH